MNIYSNVVRLILIFLVPAMLSNCSTRYQKAGNVFLAPDDFSTEIAKAETISAGDADLSVRANAYFRLAVLWSHHKNPAPDYHMALKALETFIPLDAEAGKSDEIQNFLALLKSIDALSKENQRAKDENRKTKEENQRMRETIESLKHLDIQLEKKRKPH